MTPVFITGVAGFIGAALAERLLRDGHAVAGVDNVNDYYDVSLKEARLARLAAYPQFEFVRMNLTERAALFALFKRLRPTQVVNLAAQAGVRYSLKDPHTYVESNLVGFVNILEACRMLRVEHLVYASSSSVYGASADLPFSERQCADRPLSLYGATKRANELLAYSYAHLYALPATGVRFFTVYGPWGRPDMALYNFTEALLHGRALTLYDGGRGLRDFTYIDDTVEALCRILPRPPAAAADDPPHCVVNTGGGKSVIVTEFVALLERLSGKSACLEMLPPQAGDAPATLADATRLETRYGFRPRIGLEEGLARYLEWHIPYYAAR